MPKELHGTGRGGYKTCQKADGYQSDEEITIKLSEIVGYENRDEVRFVQKISHAPSAWRIARMSDVAPADIQGSAEIFVLKGERMTITDGESSRTYTRCR